MDSDDLVNFSGYDDLVSFSGYVDPSCYDADNHTAPKLSLLAQFAAKVMPRAPHDTPKSSLARNQDNSANMDFLPPC